MARKIGILTYHHVINEGAILQAYSLSNELKKYFINDDIEIIDYRPFIIELRDLKDAFRAKSPKALIEKFKNYLKLKRFVANKLPLSKDTIITDNHEKVLNHLKERYDAIIVGSDEVWKIQKGIFVRPFPNIYWLSPEIKCKKIAFAVSANRTDYKKLADSDKEWIREALNGFDLIGIRDDQTLTFIKSLGLCDESKIYKVPDPTFMLGFQTENVKAVLEKYGVDFKRPVLGIILGNKILNKKICQHFRSKGYQIVAMSSYSSFADINLIGKINPLEWSETYKYFAFCVTDRFHPTIFSIKNKIPFLTVDYLKYYVKHESKNYSLLKDFSLLDNYVNVKKDNFSLRYIFDKIEKIIENYDPNLLNSKLQEKYNESFSFIKKVQLILEKDESIQ